MPMSFAIAVLAVFGFARIDVMKFSERDIFEVLKGSGDGLVLRSRSWAGFEVK